MLLEESLIRKLYSMQSEESISTFHGTSEANANSILAGKIDVELGGGELGQGFYLGTELHVAKAWAANRHKSEAVVQVLVNEIDFWRFSIKTLDWARASERRSEIRQWGEQRTYKFGADVVWSPIVGGPVIYCDQHKWETKFAEDFLNSASALRIKR